MPLPDDVQKKVDNLDKRIKDAKEDYKEEYEQQPTETEVSPDAIKSATAGSEFLSNVFAGAALGFAIDWYFKTTPWGMIFFILMGFVSGVIRANAAMNKNAEENEKS